MVFGLGMVSQTQCPPILTSSTRFGHGWLLDPFGLFAAMNCCTTCLRRVMLFVFDLMPNATLKVTSGVCPYNEMNGESQTPRFTIKPLSILCSSYETNLAGATCGIGLLRRKPQPSISD